MDLKALSKEQQRRGMMKEANNSSITILAIDDDSAVLTRLAEVLEGAGYCCQCAVDAETAHVALARITPDVIISDINLVGHSGLTVCEQLKQQAGICNVPVMFLSSAQVPDIIRRSHAEVGIYYLRKPFHAAVLLEIVKKVRLSAPVDLVTPAPVVPARPLPAIESPKPLAGRVIASRANSLVTH